MSKICYNKKLHFGAESGILLAHAVDIVEEYQADGYTMTLRQLYYQLVARDIISNNMVEYKRLVNIVKRGRLAGHIDWESIVDRTRNLQSLSTWKRPQDILRSAEESFKLDVWKEQPLRQEVWIEKDALLGAIEDKCEELRIAYFSCRGYTSISEVWSAAQRMMRWLQNQKKGTIIFHLADHDPAGIDMTRDIEDRMNMFINGDLKRITGEDHNFEIPVVRLGLNMDQIEEYNPPPNPVKISDSKAAKYMAQYGEESWELDALPPQVLHQLIEDAWREYYDEAAWKSVLRKEAQFRKVLAGMNEHFDRIAEEIPKWKKKKAKKRAKKKVKKK